jgi:hypothetical protein
MKKSIGGGTGEIYVLLLSLKADEEAVIFQSWAGSQD